MSSDVDKYIDDFDGEVRNRLAEMRQLVRSELPDAEESISYAIPTYKLSGRPVVYFAGYTGHIGFYATPNGHQEFAEEFSKYKQGKGSVQFPNNQPLPVDLIKRVIAYRKQQIAGDK